jgi:hypothetical protein
MPGRSPKEAVDAFLEPLKVALSCVTRGQLVLTRGAYGDVGETHQWQLNGDDGATLGDVRLRAGMHFEVLDRGASQRDQRFKVSTRGYVYGIELADDGDELISIHWHPNGTSPYRDPHYHLGEAAISPSGVFLARAHIASPRISFEHVVRSLVEDTGVRPLCDDWSERLSQTEALFDEHKSWSTRPGEEDTEA